MITTLLWDLDNTLLDFPSAERQALIATFADFTLGPCSPDLLVRYSDLNARWWRRLEEGDVTKAELLPGRFREFFAAEGIACTEYDAFNAAYQHHLGDTIVFLDNGYELVVDLPGFTKDEIKASLENGYLTISAEKGLDKDEKEKESGRYIRRERYAGACSRSFYVGEDIQQEDVKAEFKHGILKLFVPKKEAKPAVEEKKHIAIEG